MSDDAHSRNNSSGILVWSVTIGFIAGSAAGVASVCLLFASSGLEWSADTWRLVAFYCLLDAGVYVVPFTVAGLIAGLIISTLVATIDVLPADRNDRRH